MRTVITHFFNEEYLLPWWLEHHVKLFDHGVLIDHGSTDNSIDICRQIAPHWRVVKSRLTHFDAWLTDYEVMTYELELSGWKIALNVTEFLVSDPSLDEIEKFLLSTNKSGVAATGMTMIDKEPSIEPTHDLPLIHQKPWAIDDNRFNKRWMRRIFGYPENAMRNRFYHCHPSGMYHVGRHESFSIDSKLRTPNLRVLHYCYSPWNETFLARKTQIAAKIPEIDRKRGWGAQHFMPIPEMQQEFNKRNRLPFVNLTKYTGADLLLQGGINTKQMTEIVMLKNRH